MTAGRGLAHDDVMRIARQAVDLLDPDIAVEVESEDGGVEWLVWPLVDPSRGFGAWIEANASPTEALRAILDAMSQNVSETDRFRGRPFPQWLDHPHDANVELDGDAVVIECPKDGEVLARITPVV